MGVFQNFLTNYRRKSKNVQTLRGKFLFFGRKSGFGERGVLLRNSGSWKKMDGSIGYVLSVWGELGENFGK